TGVAARAFAGTRDRAGGTDRERPGVGGAPPRATALGGGDRGRGRSAHAVHASPGRLLRGSIAAARRGSDGRPGGCRSTGVRLPGGAVPQDGRDRGKTGPRSPGWLSGGTQGASGGRSAPAAVREQRSDLLPLPQGSAGATASRASSRSLARQSFG